eukprot:gb/GECH01010263.1/.p1 GENE.gb/GECH01010263.1/~~gb/GECH01010263.1/.p1  ORF type:complete len:707 (+),score=129.94 gb/GECH01010263.1/:1-2121(+)
MVLGLTTRKQEILLRIAILSLIFILAFATRLFSVLRFESVIHEFDPYFNFRSTKVLVYQGFHEFYNWFDDRSWHPLGRIVGGTVYPGLMITAAFIYWALRALHFTVDIRNVCVMLAPLFASNTTLSVYFLTREIKDSASGLLAAAMIALVPGYMSRSVAGSYDNEAVAIFALITTFLLFVRAVRTGSLFWSFGASLAYFYMVNAWGGYVFIINIVPIYVVALLLTGRYSHRLYVAYSTFYILGTLLAMQVRFVGFQAVQSGEHMAALGVFILLQLHALVSFIQSLLSPRSFRVLIRFVLIAALSVAAAALSLGLASGYISPWTGRFYTLLDPTYAKKHIPIIASVSEHQPTTWASFFFDLHILTFLLPVGLYFCLQDLTDASLFIVLYGMAAVYFAGVMVRLMLVLAPAACVLSAIGISRVLRTYMASIKQASSASSSASSSSSTPRSKKDRSRSGSKIPVEASLVLVAAIAFFLVFYTIHCSWVTSEAYSSPSIVLAAKSGAGRIIFDDFREAFYWLRYNTAEDAKIMSWWDYGYQISGMANRTVIVDNNTWNNTHIATVGKAMASNEDDAYRIMRRLDVDYALVVFGGATGYSSDDINKFLWMVRIAGSVDPNIKESQYLNSRGEYRIDGSASPTMLNSLMYKMCFYRFGEMMTEYNKPAGFDRVRQAEIGHKDFDLKHIEEAYTTEHYLVRIYKVKKQDNLIE